ncbi:hypothetical protein V6N13_015377 [Hibiscus sabdariffa]|uniref:DUF4220 domain-containing protein n=1 Tax=Hibiscus sabdariffa TaxID=183260 RepID=A0ABR2CVG8_9ROSI
MRHRRGYFDQSLVADPVVSDSKLEQKADIFSLWAPFLLLHMGGADSITAFALEDNELWRRHLLSLGVQAVAVIYVFIQTFPNENLWIPTLLVFFAGTIKGIERVRNLRMASMDKLRDFMRRKPYPGPNYFGHAVYTIEAARTVFSARGELALTTESDRNRRKILKYVSEFSYDESILIWHIATDLCYHTETDKAELEHVSESLKHRQMCKILSDYMLYLLVFQPALLSSAAGNERLAFQDTLAEAERLFAGGSCGPNQNDKACKEILLVNTDVEPTAMKGDRSKSVLFDASILAKELERMERDEKEDKWMLMSRVWVELLSYAAGHCKGTEHASLLSQGGELVTFVWLLMAHFGIREQFQMIRTSRVKLIVGK